MLAAIERRLQVAALAAMVASGALFWLQVLNVLRSGLAGIALWPKATAVALGWETALILGFAIALWLCRSERAETWPGRRRFAAGQAV